MTAFIQKIYRYDHLISSRLCDFRSRESLTCVMIIASRIGDGPAWALLGLGLLIFGGATGASAALVLTIASIICIVIFKLVKSATSRKRPFEEFPDLPMDSRTPPPDRFSFPSGHSMNAFAVAVVYGYYFPSMLVPLMALAALIAASRVFLSLHYPSDVTVGAVVGVTVASLVIMIAG
ncbi:MAG: hypothetical protein A2052_04155 [Deltaproteobacteria bacterium GWA2_54_12]|nr:MAG: hypothetical protein A2052_04155 [Deltaproteobacteria bacterium GWA2_54_12]